MFDVVQTDALDNGHVLGGEKTENLLHFDDLGSGCDIEDVAALKDGGVEGVVRNGLVEGIGGGDVGLSEKGCPCLVLETKETVEFHGECDGWSEYGLR